MADATPLFSTSWQDFKWLVKNRWKAYLYFIVFAILGGVVLGVLSFLLGGSILSSFGGGEFPVMNFGAGFFGVLILGLVFVLYVILLTFALYRSVDSTEEISVSTFFSHGKEQYWRTLGSSVGLGLIIGLVLGLAGLLMFGIASIGSQALTGLAGVLLAIAFVYYLIKIVNAWYRIVLEGEGPINALKGSMAMVEGRWWRALGSMLLWMIISVLIFFGGGFLYGLIGFFVVGGEIVGALGQGGFSSLGGLAVTGGIFLIGYYVLIAALEIIPMYGMLALYRTLRKS